MKDIKNLSKEIKYQNPAWNFKLDKVNFYSYYKKAFTKEECEKIIMIAKSKGMIKGTTKSSLDIRKSNICWLFSDDNMEWAFRRVTDIILNLNNKFFNFDIFGLNEGFQFTNYKAPSDKYGKHVDKAPNFIVRKLSVSIQLTDPKEYEGGELYLYEADKGIKMNKEQGTLVMFPSYVLHEVMPITKGERNSLVTWVTGNQFK